MNIQQVQIGLDTARYKLTYADTGNIIKDQDVAYKITILTCIGLEDDIYFEDYEEAKKYLKREE